MRSQQRRVGEKTAIVISFSAIGIGVSAAYLSPARGYELSIYRATPVMFWVGIAIAMGIAIVGSLYFDGVYRRTAAIMGGVLSVVLVVLLPYIRSYWYLGRFDALSHLATTETIMQSGEIPRVLIYPAMHILGIVFTVTTNLSTPRALGILPAVFVVLFIILIPINVKLLVKDSNPFISFLPPFLLFPIITINNPVLQPIPTTLAVLFLPLPLYLLLRDLSRQSRRFAIPLVLSFVTLVFLHPQYASAFLIFLISILIVQLISRFFWPPLVSDMTKLAVIPTITLGVVLIRWAALKPTFQGAVRKLFTLLLEGPQLGQEVGSKGAKLQRVGGGIVEIFLKLFFVEFLFALFAGGVMLYSLYRWLFGTRTQRRSVLIVVGVSLVPTSSIFLAYVFVGLPNQYFRYLSYIFVFVTIFVAIGFHSVRHRADSRFSLPGFRQTLALVFVCSVLLSTLAWYPSPYIYKPSNSVPEQHIQGFTKTFKNNATPLAAVGGSVRRFEEAAYGRAGNPRVERKFFQFRGRKTTRVPWHFANQSLHRRLEDKTYLTVTSTSRRMYIDLYDGIHYSSADFEYLETSPAIAKVQSNNEYSLYLIYPESTGGTPRSE